MRIYSNTINPVVSTVGFLTLTYLLPVCADPLPAKTMSPLKVWETALTSGDVPQNAVQEISPAQQVNGLNWQKVHVDFFQAKRYRNRSEVAALLTYEVAPSADVDERFYYWDKVNVYSNDYGTAQSYLSLQPSKMLPLALIFSDPSKKKLNQWVQLQPKDKQIIFLNAPPSAVSALKVDQVASESIPDVPALRSSGEDDDSSIQEVDTERIGGKWISGGIERTEKRGEELVWYTLQSDHKHWLQQRMPLTPTYCQSFLPKSLQTMRMVLDDRVQRVALWKDGSIIFRFTTLLKPAAKKTNEEAQDLVCQGLVMQPRQGKSRLLTWEVWRGNGNSDLPDAVWYPAASGSVVAETAHTDPGNNFVLDTDPINDCVLYLLEGQVRTIDMRTLGLNNHMPLIKPSIQRATVDGQQDG